MKADSSYTLYHPKWYRRPVSAFWWLRRWCYTKFVLREITSLFVAFAAFLYLRQLRALEHGPEDFAAFGKAMSTMPMLLLNIVTLVAVLFHAITWFHLAPRAVVLRIAGRKLSDRIMLVLNYVIWLAASGTIAWIWLRG